MHEVLIHIEDVFRNVERTLDDLVEGRLPLGGNTMKGHGIFTGNYEINPKEKEIWFKKKKQTKQKKKIYIFILLRLGYMHITKMNLCG